jgi:DNA polymerase III subunit epsilon
MTQNEIPENCIVFDTETTGFDPLTGDKLVEIGAVRMIGGLPTKETYHTYINPQRSVPDAAVKVHGLTGAFLSDKPLFEEIAQDFLDFVGDLKLTAHNAPFDAKFINTQLAEIGLPTFAEDRFIDTLPIARKRFPGSQVSLDALCRRLKISLASRDKHGALIDSELLAEVCVELMGGRQTALFETLGTRESAQETVARAAEISTFVLAATEEEKARHAEKILAKLGPKSIWAKLEGSAA